MKTNKVELPAHKSYLLIHYCSFNDVHIRRRFGYQLIILIYWGSTLESVGR